MRSLLLLMACWSFAGAAHSSCDSQLDLSSDALSLSEGMGDIHSRSLSPWTWRVSTVPTRIPSTLWEAECSSSVCWFPHMRPEGREDAEALDSGLIAVPIYQNVLVLEQRPGSRCFRPSFHHLAVGCTCVRPTSTTM
ncbi:interleukin 17a/f2 [Eucyclogobius newberryi]|uniref:interleukin 17a/f2 n=1 Tax=Eucyclogobius newberryi TaxID=166745 RepID=UPI003B5ACEE7